MGLGAGAGADAGAIASFEATLGSSTTSEAGVLTGSGRGTGLVRRLVATGLGAGVLAVRESSMSETNRVR